MKRRLRSKRELRSADVVKSFERLLNKPVHTPQRTPHKLKKQVSAYIQPDLPDYTSTALNLNGHLELHQPCQCQNRILELEHALEQSHLLNSQYAKQLEAALQKVSALEQQLQSQQTSTDTYKQELLALYQRHLFDFHRRFAENSLKTPNSL